MSFLSWSQGGLHSSYPSANHGFLTRGGPLKLHELKYNNDYKKRKPENFLGPSEL